jgi:hypothetical protein
MTAGPPAPQAMKARLLADLVQAMSSGHLLRTTAVGVLVGRNAYDLIQQSRSGESRGSSGADEMLQLHLRNVVTVLSMATRHFGDVLLAVHWYRSDAIANGAQFTPEAMTVAGRLDDVYRQLEQSRRGLVRRRP